MTLPRVYTKRGSEIPEARKLSKDFYSTLDEDQFIIFARVFIKDNVMNNNEEKLYQMIGQNGIYRMNEFFESIPAELLKFNTEVDKRLLLKYITSNIRYKFGLNLSVDSDKSLYSMIYRLSEIDPRIK